MFMYSISSSQYAFQPPAASSSEAEKLSRQCPGANDTRAIHLKFTQTITG